MNALPEQKIQGGTVTLHVLFLGLAQWQAGLFGDGAWRMFVHGHERLESQR
ncbi:hypothetical protein [Pseudomonas putida]|uniref:hypothetical protein n=1 Tax=Pseudomonas putida TaxID=303 RepID=UPI00178C5510|nr:hypothetical protein [Pseudomonas putida]